MKKRNRNLGNLFMCLTEIIIGVLLLINPIGFTSGIIIAMGILLAMLGAGSIVGYFRSEPELAARENGLSKGLICISIAFVCIFRTGWFIAAFPLITVFYGILIFGSGICKIQWAVDLLRLKQSRWYLALISAVFSLAFAMVVLLNPFSSMVVFWTFISAALIVAAVVDILVFIFGGK